MEMLHHMSFHLLKPSQNQAHIKHVVIFVQCAFCVPITVVSVIHFLSGFYSFQGACSSCFVKDH